MGTTALTVACQTYAPLATRPAPGAAVRVELTPSGMADVTPTLGTRIVALEGRVVRARAADSLEMAVDGVRTTGGNVTWAGESVVVLGPGAIAAVHGRTVSRSRTALLAGGVIAGLVAIGAAALNSGGARGGGGAGGGPPPP